MTRTIINVSQYEHKQVCNNPENKTESVYIKCIDNFITIQYKHNNSAQFAFGM